MGTAHIHGIFICLDHFIYVLLLATLNGQTCTGWIFRDRLIFVSSHVGRIWFYSILTQNASRNWNNEHRFCIYCGKNICWCRRNIYADDLANAFIGSSAESFDCLAIQKLRKGLWYKRNCSAILFTQMFAWLQKRRKALKHQFSASASQCFVNAIYTTSTFYWYARKVEISW